MAFTVPSFPLVVDVYSGPWLTKAFRFSTTGNLQVGRKTPLGYFTLVGDPVFAPDYGAVAFLLVPALTDIRGACQGLPNDLLEVPAGSGRWYIIIVFDDVAKGFPNEYRYAVIQQVHQGENAAYAGLLWPVPMP